MRQGSLSVGLSVNKNDQVDILFLQQLNVLVDP